MRLPSSSSLPLALLVVSSSSLSALAAPVGDGLEDFSSYAPAAVLLAQPNSEPPSCTTITLLSNIATDYLQTRNLVDKLTALFTALWAVPPELGKAIPDIRRGISPVSGHQGAPVAGPNPPATFQNQPPLPRGHARRQVTAGNGEGEAVREVTFLRPPTHAKPRHLVSENLTTWSWCSVFFILAPFHSMFVVMFINTSTCSTVSSLIHQHNTIAVHHTSCSTSFHFSATLLEIFCSRSILCFIVQGRCIL